MLDNIESCQPDIPLEHAMLLIKRSVKFLLEDILSYFASVFTEHTLMFSNTAVPPKGKIGNHRRLCVIANGRVDTLVVGTQ